MRRTRGLRPLYVESHGTLWASCGLKVFRSTDQGRSFTFVAKYRGALVDTISKYNRLFERLTRSGFHTLIPFDDGSCIATIRGWILRKEPDSEEFHQAFRIVRGSRPLNICLLPDGNLFFGEYFFNKEREEVHIYGSSDNGKTWSVAYTFPAGAIRHIHGIVWDPFRNGAWVFTGDDDLESKILFSSDAFHSFETALEGSQKMRAACVVPLEDGLIVPTDTPREQNYIQWFDSEKGSLDPIAPVPGSVFYGGKVGDWIVLSVSAEPSRVNTNRRPSLIVSKDGKNWKELYSKKRDIWQPPYSIFLPTLISERVFFQHPVFVLPQGTNNTSVLFAYGQAISKDDNCLLCWNLDEEASN
jgi:hypothetical protein